MKQGDLLICLSDRLYDFTIGKKYEIISYPGFPIVKNDKGEDAVPNLYYFYTMYEYRELKLNELLNE